MLEAIAFYLFSALIIGAFSVTVMSKNILYAMSSLAVGMILIGGFFFLLQADFLGVVQIIVYSGAVMALYAFGMMFFDTSKEVLEKLRYPRLGLALSVFLAFVLIVIVTSPLIGNSIMPVHPIIAGMGNTENIGIVLFTKYLVPFELASIMLLVAMIAGIVLASKKMDISLTTMGEDEITEEFVEELR